MPKLKKDTRPIRKSLEANLINIVFITLIVFTILNIISYIYPKKSNVLGIKTTNTNGVFWYDFLQANPNYLPGWLEVGRTDKAKSIDPNYF